MMKSAFSGCVLSRMVNFQSWVTEVPGVKSRVCLGIEFWVQRDFLWLLGRYYSGTFFL